MNQTVSLLLKVFLLSAAIATIIKYLAPLLVIPATPTNALIGVIGPTVVTFVALIWRIGKTRSIQSSPESDR